MIVPLQHVLCIDDEDDILEIVQLCLSDVGGIKVTGMSDVQQALSQLQVINPDLILMDMMMPGLNGIDAVLLIRKNPLFPSLPIILMTARVQTAEIQEYLNKGASAVIAKPFDPMTLSQQVTKIWDDCHGAR